jgi:hypothetical protein
VAIQPIFSGAQLAANVMTTQQLARGSADAAPLQIAQNVQLRQMSRLYERAADDATTVLSDVGATPTYDVHARVEPTPGDGQGRGQRFDQQA